LVPYFRGPRRGYVPRCDNCRSREYRNRDDVRARRREYERDYRKRPEVRERLKEYRRNSGRYEGISFLQKRRIKKEAKKTKKELGYNPE